MEILWWLAPAAGVTLLAMAWVSWVSRAGYGEVDPEVAAKRLGEALAKGPKIRHTSSPSARQTHRPSTGVARRGFETARSSRPQPPTK